MATSDFLTLSMDNRFRFDCPVFGAEVEMRSCVVLRDKVYTGHHLETRRGCQACVRAGKCPAAELVTAMAHNQSNATDHCASTEQTKGRLPAFALERIVRTIVTDAHLKMANVPSNEIDMINTANERIEAQLKTAPLQTVGARRAPTTDAPRSARKRTSVSSKVSAPETPKVTSAVAAAASGDLTAAINEA